MKRLIIEWHNKTNKNIFAIAEFHSNFELIHPFGDGNGRIGRLLMVQQCLELKYPPIIIENKNKSEYYDVLEYSQRKSSYPLVRFLVKEMDLTYQVIKRYI